MPEGSTYRIRFIVRDSLSGQKSKGGFKKVVDCIDDPVTTTTTIPISTTTTIGPVSTTTTTGPTPTTTIGPVSTTTTIVPIDRTDPDECLLTFVRIFNLENLLDCIDNNKPEPTDPEPTDPDPTDPEPTDPDPTDPTGITTTSEEDDFCEGLILEEGDICEGPLTDDEGNDFFEWDEYDEGVYLTDGSYTVQYFYTEDSMKLAATGINLSNMVISSILLLFSGLFFFTKSRKRKLLSAIKTVNSKDLENYILQQEEAERPRQLQEWRDLAESPGRTDHRAQHRDHPSPT